MDERDLLRYRCENDECMLYQVVVVVWPGDEAACKVCGQMMHATGNDDED